MARADYFLKLEGIEGESTDDKHKKLIEVESFSWGETNDGSFGSTGAGGGTGKVHFQDIHFTTLVSKASPLIADACATGKHIAKAELNLRKAGGKQQDYYQIKLTDVLVSSYQSGGSGQGGLLPVDQFSLNFTKIEYSFQAQDNKGNVGGPVKMGWDLKANKKL